MNKKLKTFLKSLFITMLGGSFTFIILMPISFNIWLSNINGFYVSGDINELGIRTDGNFTMWRLRYVLTHEVGHYVWFKCLNKTQRFEFRELYKNLDEECKYLDEVNEDFAESYTYFLITEEFPYQCMNKYKWFYNLSVQKLRCVE